MRVLAEYVMRGRRQAVIAALIASVIPLFSWVSVVIMALVTLRKGAQEGLMILACFSLSTWTMLQFGHVSPIIGYTSLLGGLVVWGQACLLRQRQSWSLVLEVTVVVAVLVIGLVHLFIGDVQAWWQMHLSSLLQGMNQRLQLPMSQADVAALVAFMARIFTGLQALSVLFNALINLLFARGCQAVDLLYKSGNLNEQNLTSLFLILDFLQEVELVLNPENLDRILTLCENTPERLPQLAKELQSMAGQPEGFFQQDLDKELESFETRDLTRPPIDKCHFRFFGNIKDTSAEERTYRQGIEGLEIKGPEKGSGRS